MIIQHRGYIDSEWMILFWIILIMVLFVAGLAWGAYFYGRYECRVTADKMGMAHDYGLVTGCMVRPDETKRWMPIERYRVISDGGDQ